MTGKSDSGKRSADQAEDRYDGTANAQPVDRILREQMRRLSGIVGRGGKEKITAAGILKDAAAVCFAGAGMCFVGTVALPVLALGGVALMGAGIASSLGFEFNDLLR